MKKLFIILTAIVLIQIQSFAQTDWTYYPNNELLCMDTTYMWASYGQPTVIIHQDTFKMWYAVASGVDPLDTVPRGRIHYAWSLDGYSWTKYPGNPVLDIGTNGDWDDEWLDTPEILWDGTEFKLYYYGDSTYFQGQANTNIGLATSNNGINWTKQGVVLQKGALNEWDGDFIESPAAYYDTSSGVYALIYQGKDTVGYIKLGLAVSPDTYNWIKYPDNPVIDIGPSGAWDDMFAAVPSMIESDGIFELWYSGVKHADQWDSVRIGYATSINGTDWIKYPGNPVLRTQLPDTSDFWAVDVVWDKNDALYKMYYENVFKWDASAIYLATSPREVLFSSNCNTSISNDTLIYQGDSIQLSATGGVAYSWMPEYGLSSTQLANPMAFPDTTTTYYVMIVSDSCIIRDTVVVSVSPTNIKENNALDNDLMQIYPNPCKDIANINFKNNTTGHQLFVYDQRGAVVRRYKRIQGSSIRFENKDLAKGMYYFLLYNTEKLISVKSLVIE